MENNLPLYKRDWFWHAVFWIGYYVLKVFVVEFFRTNFWEVALTELIHLPLKMAALYTLIYLLIPNLLLRKKYVLFTLALLVSIVIVAFLRRVSDIFVVYNIAMLYDDNMDLWNIRFMFRNLIFIYPVVGLGAMAYFIKEWYHNYWLTQKLKKEKLEAELSMLKAQVHPHFLFNTINNIYSLALEKSSRTPNALLRLSDLLHYMLYECNQPRQPLVKEIDMMKSYIELEQLRYGDRLDIQLRIDDIPIDIKIAPLILIPFVENCFKHGVSETIDQSWIAIDLRLTSNQMTLKVDNSKADIEEKKGDHKNGIGLSNVRRRLNLEYPDRHTLEVIDQKEAFLIKLEVALDEN
ncbi:MAG: histidine kinase [Cyclobacteriaceae bacterium]